MGTVCYKKKKNPKKNQEIKWVPGASVLFSRAKCLSVMTEARVDLNVREVVAVLLIVCLPLDSMLIN